MEQFLPEQVGILAEVLNDPAIVTGAASGLSLEESSQFLSRVTAFIKQNHTHIGARPFAIVLESAANGQQALSLQNVLKALAESAPLIIVNQSLQVSSFSRGGLKISDAEQRTMKSDRIEILVHGTYLYCIGRGQIIDEHDAVVPEKDPPVGIAFYKPIIDFDGLLQDHYEQDVSREKSFRYWENKAERKLLATPEKTEKIFQRALLNWLDRYVTDKIRIVAETREFGQDPTDVLVVTTQGDHVIEVKWLGKNEKGTHYDKERINEGLRQVRQYITNDPRIIQAHLVLYDARFPEESRSHSDFDPGCKHPFCSDPKIVLLPSESASQAARLAPTRRRPTAKKASAPAKRKKPGKK